MTDDKRKHSRIPVTAKVSRTTDKGKKDFYFTKDLSAGGVYLVTDRELPVGTVLNLEISIQGIKDLLIVRGKVVRIEKREGKIEGLGVQFIDIDESLSIKLKNFLNNS